MELPRHLELLRMMVQRDLAARYRESALGRLWPFVAQLTLLLLYTYVFSFVLKQQLHVEGLPESRLTFAVWLFAGLLPWIAFNAGVTMATVSVINQPNLVKRVVFPLPLLPLVPVFGAFVEMLCGLVALLALLALAFHHASWFWLLLPLVWVPQLLLTMGAAWLVASFTVFVRDTQHVVPLGLTLVFFLTPIVYPATLIPEPIRPWMEWLNPMAALAEVHRNLLLGGRLTCGPDYLVVWAFALGASGAGYAWFRHVQHGFADVV
jgi:lipopolysaccharide transport system permease protein